MPTATRDIQRRIRSVTSTKKITKAMELVASAKMRRASQAVLATRPYTDHAWDMLVNLAQRTDPSKHPLLREHAETKSIGVILVASNRGLVGGFNTALTSTIAKAIQRLASEHGPQAEVILMGKKGRTIMTHHDVPVTAEFNKEDIITNVVPIQPMSKLVINRFLDGTLDRVYIGYMEFVSTLVQKPRFRQLLPLGGIEQATASTSDADSHPASFEYLFEPSPDEVLEFVLPRLVEMQIYRAVLETNAAEQAARMVAMKNAADAAGDLIDDLTLTFNQARQASITQDLSEISAGRAALEA